MLLDLKELIRTPGERKSFDFQLDLSQMEFYGQHPFAAPVKVSGKVENHAGMLLMTGLCEAELSVRCDLCGVPFTEVYRLPMEHMLAESVEDEENDEIVLLQAQTLNVGEVAAGDLILEMPSTHRCRADCRGRCFRCGANLNEEPCRCQQEPDPRMAVLAKLLQQQD